MSKKPKTSTSEVEKKNVDDLLPDITYEWLDKMIGDCKKIIEYLSLNKNRIQITKAQFEKLTKERILSEAFDNLERKEAEDVRTEGTYSLKKWPHIEKFVKDPEIQQAANKFYTKCLFKYLYDKYEGDTMKKKWYDAIKKNSIRKNLLDDKINRTKDTLTKINKKINNVIKHKKEMFVLSTVKIEVDQIKTDVDKIEQVEQDIRNFQYFTSVQKIDRGDGYPGIPPIMRVFVESNTWRIFIPDTVTEIDYQAFLNANIQAIHLPNSLKTIEKAAFLNSSLKSITIPDSVTSIGDRAFLSSSITTIKLSKSLKIIPNGLCHNCRLEDIEIPNNVTDIKEKSFYSNYIKKIIFGNSVKRIGKKAFAYNNITRLTITNSVKYIHPYAFYKNKIEELLIGTALDQIHPFTFAKNKLNLLYIPENVKSIGEYAFKNNKLKHLTIDFGCKKIGKHAFIKNKLTSVRIPASVKELARDAFDPNVTIIREGDVAGTSATTNLLQLKL